MKPPKTATHALRPKVAIPDCVMFIQTSSIRSLYQSAKSPFKTLKNHPSTARRAGVPEEAAFRFQSTPCSRLPETACFEFASCFFEDKKPSYEHLEHAYRQNRMATASAVRHLHSLRVRAPVFGLLWVDGTVRAHVDWCAVLKGEPVSKSPCTRPPVEPQWQWLLDSIFFRHPIPTPMTGLRIRSFANGTWKDQRRSSKFIFSSET